MRLIRLGLGNVNATVGATNSNAARVIDLAHQADKDGVTVLAFPEQVLGGYPAEDWVQWRGFVEAQASALMRVAHETRGLHTVLALGVVVSFEGAVYNAAALVFRGRVLGIVPKEKLPNYSVFYESRTFSRGGVGLLGTIGDVPFGDLIFETELVTIALDVCEDAWSPQGPMARRAFAGADLLLNLSASPYRLGILATRREMFTTRSSDNQLTLATVNLVGGNDGLVFDGGGLVAQNGRLLGEAPRFREGLFALTLDMDRTRRLRMENTTFREDAALQKEVAQRVHRIRVDGLKVSEGLVYPAPESFFLPKRNASEAARAAFAEEILDVLTVGVGDYFEKTRAFRTMGVSLSGGRDSLLVLLVAHRYVSQKYAHLGAETVKTKVSELLRVFFMPTRFSSNHAERAAVQAAADLGIPLVVESVEEAFSRELEAVARMLAPGESLTDLARQNIQARVRAARMWTWANSAAGLFLQTSNMSEKACGYVTIGGDGEGALSVIANVPKTLVNFLLEHLSKTTGFSSIALTTAIPASAELREDQEDERDLMPFEILDACFFLFAGEKMSPKEVVSGLSAMFPDLPKEALVAHAERFQKLFVSSIYKWVQAPLSIHVGNLDLERERALQLPVVQSTEWYEG